MPWWVGGPKDYAPRPRATAASPDKGFPSRPASARPWAGGKGVELPLSEAWFSHPQKYLMPAQSNPRFGMGPGMRPGLRPGPSFAFRRRWLSTRKLKDAPSLSHPTPHSRPPADAPACSAPGPSPRGPPGRARRALGEVSFSSVRQKAAKRRQPCPGGGGRGVEAHR